MQQGSGSVSTSMLTDEQILDMELTPGGELVSGDAATGGSGTRGAARDSSARDESDVILSGAGRGLYLEPAVQSKDLSGGVRTVEPGEILRRPPGRTPQNDSKSDMAVLEDVSLLNDVAPTGDADIAAVGASQDATSAAANAGDPGRVATGDDPAWLKTLEAQPQGGREAAAEARTWRAAATDVASLDAAYFSADPGARSGLAARLYDSDPAAFRAMLAESARTMAQRDPQGLAELARELGAASSAASLAATPHTLLNAVKSAAQRSMANGADGSTLGRVTPDKEILRSAAAQNDSLNRGQSLTAAQEQRAAQLQAAAQQQAIAQQNNPASQAANAFPAEAYRSFEAATNEDVARRVHRAIDHTLGATLPEGMAEGARRRIAEDIFQEVHASLAADRDLGRRLSETLRDWRFDAAARQQVSSLLTGRARAVLPEVARRVVAEWTSSVLATDRAKTARIDAASARRDITGGRLPEPVPASSLRPRDLDYRRLSDEQIMEL